MENNSFVRVNVFFKVIVYLLLPLIILTSSLYFYTTTGDVVTTENAYVKSDVINVSSEVEGVVSAVYVSDNTSVAKGEKLFSIDPIPYQIKYENLKSELDLVEKELLEMQTTYRTYLESLNESKITIDFLKKQLSRYETLLSKGAITYDMFDQKKHKLDLEFSKNKILKENIKKISIALDGKLKGSIKKHPKYIRSVTNLQRAQLDLDKTTIFAPANGTLIGMKLQSGEFISAGKPIFNIIDDNFFWIEANFKETQLTNVRVGQIATATTDMYPDIQLDGKVISIAKASGSEFALLPPQNASGNWVKVVQRIPVEISINQIKNYPFRIGMTVTVSIQTGVSRGIPRSIEKIISSNLLPNFLREKILISLKKNE
ncbi:MAG: HlyD family secretion protein [Hydrogenophilales bacterium]